MNGFCIFKVQCNPDKANAIVSFSLSSLSFDSPAFFKKIGAEPYKSQILSRRLRGSNILTGREIPIILCPEKTFDAACLITSFTMPLDLSSAF